MPKYVKLFPLQAMTFQKWPSWSCEILNILFKGQFYYYKENIFWEKLHKFILADIILFASGEKFFRASICVWPRERDWPWAKQTRSDCIHYLWRLYRVYMSTVHPVHLYTLTFPSTCSLARGRDPYSAFTARHDFSLQSGSNIAKIFSTIKSTQISSS